MDGIRIAQIRQYCLANNQYTFRWDCRNQYGSFVPTGGYGLVVMGPGLKWWGKCAVYR